MDKINFRAAEINDLPILHKFEQGIVSTERPFDPTLKNEHINYYNIKAMITANDVAVIVALVNDEIIASAYVKIKKAPPYLKFEHYAYLGFMYVRPKYRGQGVSQKVIEQAEIWAKLKNLNELRLEVYDENISAIAAYEKFGFKKHIIEMRVEI